MGKLKLNLDEIKVESFVTNSVNSQKGTVNGYDVLPGTEQCSVDNCGGVSAYTCQETCISCPASCTCPEPTYQCPSIMAYCPTALAWTCNLGTTPEAGYCMYCGA